MSLKTNVSTWSAGLDSQSVSVDSQSQIRIAEALERIADSLERFEFQGAVEEVCQHPESEREPTVSSTMQNVIMRCKACGAEGI